MSLLTTSDSSSVLDSLADLLDPPDDAFGLLDFTPNPGPQSEFLAQFEEPNTDLLYGGAAGGSKSTSLLLGSLRACHRYPGLQAFWFRRTFPELRHSVLRLLARYDFAAALGCRWLKTEHELQFPNGSILTFAHAKNMEDATALQSGEIQLLLIDERTTIPPDVVDMLYSRVRSGIPGLPCLGIRSATNPGNIGHSRVKAEYVEATEHGKKEITDGARRKRRFIQARLSDTPQLDESYADSLAGLPEALRKAFLDGDWDSFSGQVFAEWRYDRHVLRPFALAEGWKRIGGIDWGMRHPSGVVFAAEDQDGRVWVYNEIYQSGLGEKGLAAAIKAKTGTEHVVFAFDPSMMNQVGDAMPVASALQLEGIPLKKATNDRLSGWMRVHSYLAEAPACDHHRALGWETCPLLHVFDNCIDLIRTLPAVPYNTTGKLEDVDTHSDDHLPDALRYMLMMLGHMSRMLTWDEGPPTHAPDGSPLLPVMGGHRVAGDTSTGLNPDQKANGKVAVSPFA